MNLYEVKTAAGNGFLVSAKNMIDAANNAEISRLMDEEIVSIVKVGKNGWS